MLFDVLALSRMVNSSLANEITAKFWVSVYQTAKLANNSQVACFANSQISKQCEVSSLSPQTAKPLTIVAPFPHISSLKV